MMSTVFFIIVLLHLVAGFAYLAYKLSPSKKAVDVNSNINEKFPVNKKLNK